jgi:hypothetical protein
MDVEKYEWFIDCESGIRGDGKFRAESQPRAYKTHNMGMGTEGVEMNEIPRKDTTVEEKSKVK